ncbi:MAG: cytochrome c biogenesis CcdA family protein [Fibrobacterota bacterium]
MKSFFVAVYGIILCTVLIAAADDSDHLEVHYFGESTCRDCHNLEENILDPLEEKLGERLTITRHNILNPEKLEKLKRFEQAYGIERGNAISLFVADTFLLGFDDIKNSADSLILNRVRDPEKYSMPVTDSNESNHVAESFQNFSFWLITLAGLADGINPCAIATMIFLISFLATRKINTRETIVVGQSFIITVFLTYFTIGLGGFHALRSLEEYHIISEVIRWAAILLCVFVAAFSLRDALVFYKTRDIGKIRLQLPDSVKAKIHRVIRERLTGRNMIIGACITGFLVTLFETICTAQTYLPVLRVLTQHEELRFQAYLWLLYYNFLFIVPLQAVMIAAYKGMTWNSLAQGTQKNMVHIKIAIAMVMIFLAGYLYYG